MRRHQHRHAGAVPADRLRRSQTAFSEGGLPIGASLEDLGKGLRSQVGTMFASNAKGPRYLEMAEGYCTRMALNKDNEVIGYELSTWGR